MYIKLLLLSLLTITTACFAQENGKVINGVLLKTIENWSLPNNITNNPDYDHIESIIKLNTHVALQINYKTKGLKAYDYPLKETYNPEYSFEQTAWDTLFFFSYPEMEFQKKVALEIPMQCIKSVQQIRWPKKELTLIQYCEGIELHKSENYSKDTLIFVEREADLVALAPNGKKLSYINYKESGTEEPFANCIIDYVIDEDYSYPYNRLLTEPIDDYVGDFVSRVAGVSDNNRYDSIKYNLNNELVYYKHGTKPVRMKTRLLSPPSSVYFVEYSGEDETDRLYPKIIDSKYISGNLYILSYIDDFELDYKGYTLSMLNVESNMYLARHVHEAIGDDGKTIEYNPETSSRSEIRDHLIFNLEPDIKADSIKLAPLLPEKHDLSVFEYIFDVNDSILVFAHHAGLCKYNNISKEYISFGYADILIWIGWTGSKQSLTDYKSIHLTNDNKIITVQENNMIMEWMVWR